MSRRRPSKRERQRQQTGSISMDTTANYGKSCANVDPFSALQRAKDWSYNGRTAGRIHRS